jgi:uncharacterized protein (TIGR03435 family)
MMRAALAFGLAALLCVPLAGQSGPAPVAAPAKFGVVDVHTSPATMNPLFRVSAPRNGRYEIRRATMVELIRTAYGVELDKILGGPHWLELDRYDITAQVPAGTTRESVRPMLQAMLAERFALVLKEEIKPVAANAIVRGTGELRLKESPGGVATTCQQNIQASPAQGGIVVTMTCRGISLAAFAEQLTRSPTIAGITGPVVDATGLAGSFDFDLQFTPGQLAPLAGAARGATFADAFKQAGLMIESKTVPLPTITVESVNRTPAPNDAAAVAKAFPPGPSPEFEVADVRPAAPQSRANMQILPNGTVNITNIPLRILIGLAWEPPGESSIVGNPAALDKTYDLVGRVSTGPIDPAGVDREVIGQMIQKLLADALKITARWEERPVKAYSLVVDGNHKLVRAPDPNARTRCTDAAAARAAGSTPSVPTRTQTCQNMTMTEFAERLQRLGAGAPNSPFAAPVLDETKLDGRWNFSMTFMIPGLSEALARARAAAPGASAAPGGAGASDPTGAMTLEEAIDRQLGLKLRERQRPARVLVVDVPESLN